MSEAVAHAAPTSAVAHARCGARTRSGGACRNVAGFRTEHVGDGRCYLHGGRNPTKHGRYSTIKRAQIRELIEKHEADPDPLDILPELAAARALFQDYVDRYDEWRDALIAWHNSFSDEYREAVKQAFRMHDHTAGPFIPPDPSEDYGGKPHQVLDVADAYRIVSEITKIVERIEKVRAQNAITYDQLRRFLFGVESVIREHVKDDRTVDKIRSGLLSLRP